MKKYIFGEKNSIHIIDLTQTVDFIKNALFQVHKTISAGGKLLVVSTKKQASEQISELAKKQINIMLITDGLEECSQIGIQFKIQ